jgi:hypothetical protein
MKYYRSLGYTIGCVERSNFAIHVTNDLFNIIDFIAIKPGEILGVQSTSYGAASAHRKKIREEPLLREWINAGGRLELILWRKPKFRWEAIIETFN